MPDKAHKVFDKQVARYHQARSSAEGSRIRALLAGEPQLETIATPDGLKTLASELKALKLERRALKKIEALALKAAETKGGAGAPQGAKGGASAPQDMKADKPAAPAKSAPAKAQPAKPAPAKPATKAPDAKSRTAPRAKATGAGQRATAHKAPAKG